jgi:magnesium transporter
LLKFLIDDKLSLHRHVKWREVQELAHNKKPFYIDIVSPKKEDIDNLRSIFGFHPTNLEDCTYFSENPKVEEHRNYLFTVVHNVVFNEEKNIYESHDVHIFLGENYIITAHDKDLNIFHEVMERVLNGLERKSLSCDFVYYTVLDSIVDSYYPILTYWSERIDNAEEYVYDTKVGDEVVNKVVTIRKGLLALKRALIPQREVFYRISHTGISFIGEDIRDYLKDVYDHTSKSCDMIEDQRDMLSNLMDAHFSKTSAGLNEVMKRLTILSTIFMPLTFIVGIYGMNFRAMPELQWKYGYFLVMLVMFLTGLSLFIYFKKKKWF